MFVPRLSSSIYEQTPIVGMGALWKKSRSKVAKAKRQRTRLGGEAAVTSRLGVAMTSGAAKGWKMQSDAPVLYMW